MARSAGWLEATDSTTQIGLLYEDREAIQSGAEAVYLRGDLAPLCDFIETRYCPVLSNLTENYHTLG